MITKTNTTKFGGTLYLRIPPHLVQYLELDKNMEVNIQDDNGKHGKFLSFWRADQK